MTTRTRRLPPVEVLNEWFVEDPPGVLRWRKDYGTERNGATIIGRAGEVAGHESQERVKSASKAAAIIGRD